MCYAALRIQSIQAQLGPYQFGIQYSANVPEQIVYPMQPMPFASVLSGQGLIREGQFGLLPAWVDEKRGGAQYSRKWKTYNARSEGLFERPTFREAARLRRAAIPV